VVFGRVVPQERGLVLGELLFFLMGLCASLFDER
jgi:hypothetical protein